MSNIVVSGCFSHLRYLFLSHKSETTIYVFVVVVVSSLSRCDKVCFFIYLFYYFFCRVYCFLMLFMHNLCLIYASDYFNVLYYTVA